MRSAWLIVSTTALTVLAISCAGSPAAPAAPSSQPIAFAGTWNGAGVDSQGATTVTWSLTQTGASVSGTVATQAVDPNDGSCNSCHRNKSGAVSGTISGTKLTLTMFFAAGGSDDPTPACSATVTGTASSTGEGALAGEYSGADTCEGPFTNGTLTMTRQR